VSGILSDLRVLDRSTGIAGPYCTKLLADAGADVVRVETQPDPLRAWRSGGLWEFLNQAKRTVAGEGDLAAAADVLVTDAAVTEALDPGLVVVTITPVGTDGPWAGRPETEFTLQAAAGSTGLRGWPDEPPLAAGGRVGEWAAGAYAAVAALAAWREACRSGKGERIDLAILDTIAVTMVTFPSVFASFLGWPPMRGTGRAIEVPSIEPTTDGFAVFTTNSAQQFHDFCTMIGRPEWGDDPEMARVNLRFRRRAEFLAAVHAHTAARTTAEVLEEASVLRIPSGPVLNGASITTFEHFAERGVFEPSPSGRGVQPRVPYRIAGVAQEAPAPRRDWIPRSRPGDGTWRLPLEGVRVVDCTAWWAGPVNPHALACLGADVIKVESVTRPDLMRFSATKAATEDRWWEWGPIFHGVNAGKRGITLDLTRPEGIDVFERLLATADILVENYTPRVMDQFGLTWDRVHAINPSLIMVRMPAFGLDGPWRDRTGFAQTMESVSGMAWLTGAADGPPVLVRGAGDPIAGIHAALATLLALTQRDRDGEGRMVESVMVEAVLNVAAEQVIEHSISGEVLTRDGNRGPSAAPQGIYRCAGEDAWVAAAVADDDQWTALRGVLGDPAWAADPALLTEGGRRLSHDRIDLGISAWTADRDADEVASRLCSAGVPAAVVVPGRDGLANPQLRHRGLAESEDHPVTGVHDLPTLPFRFSRVDRWHRRPSPTLGEHNDEVLASLGLSPAEIVRLRELGVIGERLRGA
jgi:crotonobetainyl-CoA:carnitine CoA-transferase CaiB-like acyl-CoA transferase